VTATSTKKGQQSYLSFTEAASNLSGTLTVNDGTHTANIQLLGQYTASEFAAASDGHGGTLISFTSPPSGSPGISPCRRRCVRRRPQGWRGPPSRGRRSDDKACCAPARSPLWSACPIRLIACANGPFGFARRP
jgi:hypothetical protein